MIVGGCANDFTAWAQGVQIQLFIVANLRSFVSNFALMSAR